jgi:hypothetical protein
MLDLNRIAEPSGIILCWFDFMSVLGVKSDIFCCLTNEFYFWRECIDILLHDVIYFRNYFRNNAIYRPWPLLEDWSTSFTSLTPLQLCILAIISLDKA